jgi:hypothetical protein
MLGIAGSIPDEIIGIYHWLNSSSCTLALGSTWLLTEIIARNNSWGLKAAGV